jgi:hypothetical protein
MDKRRVVLLSGEGASGEIAARYLAARFDDLVVIVERPESRMLFLRRRLKRLGLMTVVGQMAFMLFQRIQERWAHARIQAIVAALGSGKMPTAVEHVSSVNTPECIALLRKLGPAVVLVMGTRIISREVLRAVDAPFINYHAGITPKYRGVHGGYWALAQSDPENCGATVHVVDEGIDSGSVLFQTRVHRGAGDNFSTYPYLQLAAALPLLVHAAEEARAGHLAPQPSSLPSRLWSHPTLWGYLATGLRQGVW